VIDIVEVEKYLDWKRDKELYPPRWTPEDYVEHVLNTEARQKLQKIYDIFDNEDPGFLASNTNALVDMIEEIINGN
jgi:hypothetical protein